MVMHLALLLALVSRWKERQANVPNFETSILSSGIVHNVCVSAVVRFENVSVHRDQTLNEDKNFELHVTAPLQKHFVSGWPFCPP